MAQRLLKGESYDKIDDDLKVARGTIYTVKSKIKRKGLLYIDSGDILLNPVKPSEGDFCLGFIRLIFLYHPDYI